MVCNKCQKLGKGTTLATPGVKKKSEMYYGSPASSSSSASGTKSATLGQTGIGKSKLLSKNAKNPYAQYSSSCTKCKTKISQGHSYCNKCAYQANICAMCGKSSTKTKAGVPVVSGAKFTLK
ncbi:putative cript family protein [Phaeoacremonium minimum UCRPA7]|uniref:Cysteine-rich PDZ-binding protein n=1 Tax=Phaeoacremonium minimum (strain UCR-PA7) TaxID=1286976 RepID=R8BTP2_PHAM7|nr:putative cript family protein [Phaeoacremonium minimum UCRPA7]EOO02737.1 putative cript family protein [Phaeoacremonium minimum UCRPA7]